MKKLLYPIAVVLIVIASCDKPVEELAKVDFGKTLKISLSIDKDSIPADGETRARISISAPYPDSFGKTATLTVSPVGTLMSDDGTGTASTTSVVISQAGTATAYIISTMAGIATIKATVDGKSASSSIKLTSPAIQFIVEGDSLPVGNRLVKATAKATKAWRGKTVRFEISPIGQLSDPANPSTPVTSLALTLSQEGDRSVYFGSSVAGSSYLRVTIENQSSLHLIKFYNSSPYTLQVSNDNQIADNYLVATLSVTSDGTIFKNKTASFTTDKGTFSNGQQTYTAGADVDGVVKAYLKSSRAETSRVIVTLPGNITKEQTVTFTPATPTLIFVDPGESTLTSELTSKTTVTARLERVTGIPSDNQAVVFSDSTEVNSSIGAFLNVTNSGTTRQATAQYWIQNTTYTGFVYIKACVTRPDGKKICGLNRILIQ